MGKQYRYLTENDMAFIGEQKLFYMASSSGREVNLSPKGYDCIRVVDNETLIYMDYPGSGNRTARDIEEDGEVTVLFNAFEGNPRILRIFCKGELIEKDDVLFHDYMSLFEEKPGVVRRLIRLTVWAVESSCGMSVPEMEYKGDRSGLRDWAVKQEAAGTLEEYIKEHETPPNLVRFCC